MLACWIGIRQNTDPNTARRLTIFTTHWSIIEIRGQSSANHSITIVRQLRIPDYNNLTTQQWHTLNYIIIEKTVLETAKNEEYYDLVSIISTVMRAMLDIYHQFTIRPELGVNSRDIAPLLANRNQHLCATLIDYIPASRNSTQTATLPSPAFYMDYHQVKKVRRNAADCYQWYETIR